MIRSLLAAFALTAALAASAAAAPWAKPKSPVIPEASGYVVIPNAAVPPERGRLYKAIFDATRASEKPTQLLPALDMAGSELNAFGVAGVPAKDVRFAVVFHGPAMDGILDEAHYRAKYKVSNPNIPILRELKRSGVELYVCGQNLAFEGWDRKAIAPEVTVASDALIVLMKYQSTGYALMSF